MSTETEEAVDQDALAEELSAATEGQSDADSDGAAGADADDGFQ